MSPTPPPKPCYGSHDNIIEALENITGLLDSLGVPYVAAIGVPHMDKTYSIGNMDEWSGRYVDNLADAITDEFEMCPDEWAD